MPTPEELAHWRDQAQASGDAAGVAQIDAELAKVQPKQAAPMDDYEPLRQAYLDKQHAVANGAPKELLDAIDTHINGFLGKMREADTQRQLEEMGPGGRFLAGAGRGLTNVYQHAKDLAHDIGTGTVSAGMLPATAPQDPAYEQQRNAQREQFLQETAPLTSTTAGALGNVAGEAAGTAPIALATGGTGPVAEAAGAFGPIAGGALAGAGTGALLAEPGERAKGALEMGALGGGLGLLGRVVSAPMRGIVTPTKEAQQLGELGIKGITAGQAAPRSAIAHFEQAAESTPFGASVKTAREELPLNLEHRIIQEAAPPGFKPTLGRDELVGDRVSELGAEYNRRYSDIFGANHGPLPRDYIQHKILRQAANPSGHVLAPSDTDAASKFVADELAKLDQNNSLQTLHNIRSNVGDKVRSLQRSNPELSGHFKDIKTSLTGEIEDALSASPDPEAFSKLQSLDAAYKKYKTVIRAVPIDPGGSVSITPHRLSEALRAGMTPDQYAKGAGGDLRTLARAGKIATSPPRPTTGALTGVLRMIPFAGSYGTGALGYASSHFPNALTGQTLPQRILQQTLGQPVVSGALGQGLRAGGADLLLNQRPPETPEEKRARVLMLTLGGQQP